VELALLQLLLTEAARPEGQSAWFAIETLAWTRATKLG